MGYWNIYGGVILSIFIAWKNDFSRAAMDDWTSYLVLLLTCISLLTFFKITIFKKKGTPVDNIAMSQSSIRAASTAIDPLKSGEEVGTVIIETMKGTKKIMKKIKSILTYIWGNKITLLSIISNLIVSAYAQYLLYTDTLKDFVFFQEHIIIFRVVVTILCVLWLITNIYAAINKLGLESLEELKERSEALKNDTTDKLSNKQKKVLKNELATFTDGINECIKKIKEIEKAIVAAQTVVNNLDTITGIGLYLNADQVNEYSRAKETISTMNAKKAELEKVQADLEIQSQKIQDAIKK